MNIPVILGAVLLSRHVINDVLYEEYLMKSPVSYYDCREAQTDGSNPQLDADGEILIRDRYYIRYRSSGWPLDKAVSFMYSDTYTVIQSGGKIPPQFQFRKRSLVQDRFIIGNEMYSRVPINFVCSFEEAPGQERELLLKPRGKDAQGSYYIPDDKNSTWNMEFAVNLLKPMYYAMDPLTRGYDTTFTNQNANAESQWDMNDEDEDRHIIIDGQNVKRETGLISSETGLSGSEAGLGGSEAGLRDSEAGLCGSDGSRCASYHRTSTTAHRHKHHAALTNTSEDHEVHPRGLSLLSSAEDLGEETLKHIILSMISIGSFLVWLISIICRFKSRSHGKKRKSDLDSTEIQSDLFT